MLKPYLKGASELNIIFIHLAIDFPRNGSLKLKTPFSVAKLDYLFIPLFYNASLKREPLSKYRKCSSLSFCFLIKMRNESIH